MSGERHTIAESFCVMRNADKSIIFFEAGMALARLYKRIPAGARLMRLPDQLDEVYTREVHLYKDTSDEAQFAELSRREWNNPGQLFCEYSTDYEL